MSKDHPSQIPDASWLAFVKQQVKSLHFGVVQIVVHNDRVVQIERTEKVRLDSPTAAQFDPSI
jgi:hypothetical protein